MNCNEQPGFALVVYMVIGWFGAVLDLFIFVYWI
jgi:hypothetical protein